MSADAVTTEPKSETDAAPGSGSPEPEVADRFFDTVVTGVSLACLLGLVVRLAGRAVQPLTDPGTFVHLRAGHELWGSWSLGHPGALSRYATASWVPTRWGTEMLAAKVEDWFGLPGVAWLSGLVFVAVVLVVYASCRRGADLLVSTIVTGAAVIGAAGALSAGPQVLSLLLFAVSGWAWSRVQAVGGTPWVLVPLTWVWACLDQLWWTGAVLGLVVAVGAVLEGQGSGRPWRLLAVPLLSVAAAALTPLGPRLLSAPADPLARAFVVPDWQATSFRDPSALLVAVMAGVLLLLWTRHGHVGATRAGLLLLACGGAAWAHGLLGFAAVLLAPMLATGLTDLRGRLRPTRGQLRAERWVIGIGVVLVLAATALVAPATAGRPGDVPAAFGPRLAALPAGSGVLVEDTVGSWVEWRFPRLDPTVDTLFDSYDVGYLRRFATAQAVEAGWASYVAETRPDAAVLLTGSPLTAAMRTRLGWRQVAHDGRWVYLVPPQGGTP